MEISPLFFVPLIHGQFYDNWLQHYFIYVILCKKNKVFYYHVDPPKGIYQFLWTSRNLFSLRRGLVCSKSLALHDSVCLSVFRDLDPGLKAALREFLAARGVNSKLAGSILHHLLQKERSQYVNWLKTLEKTFAKNHWLYPHLKIYKLSFLAESTVNIFVVLMGEQAQFPPIHVDDQIGAPP